MITLAFFCIAVHSADAFKIHALKIKYKEGQPLAGFDLQQGKLPCKKDYPCLFFHKDSDNLRLIIEGKNIRMAYKSEDKEPLPFQKNFSLLRPEEKTAVIEAYRDFLRSEFALMLQTFVYTAPEIFNWDVGNFKAEQSNHLISAQEVKEILESGKPPKLYTVFKIKCQGGETLVFESDGSGSFFMEIK
ncbi:MAG: hypothetical protein LBH25_04195 [Fibromonadaceae bacterium]|nr:hypothetical protein [Fibromonadaceae bacterium]